VTPIDNHYAGSQTLLKQKIRQSFYTSDILTHFFAAQWLILDSPLPKPRLLQLV
jgi:hypothetical protein